MGRGHRVERSHGTFIRSVGFPRAVDASRVTARCNDRGAHRDVAEDIDHEGDEHPDQDRVIAPLLNPEEGRMNENEHPRGHCSSS